MQPLTTSADKTLTGPRPDTADKARTPAPAGGPERHVTPFGTVFHASQARSGPSRPIDPEPEQTTEVADGTGPEALSGEDEGPGRMIDATPPSRRDPAADADPGQNAQAETGEAATRRSAGARTLSPQALPDGDPRPGDADEDARTAAFSAPDRAGPTPIETAGRSPSTAETAPLPRGAAPERMPERAGPQHPPQLVAGAARAAPDIGRGRAGGTAGEAADGRVSTIHAHHDARLSSPTGAGGLANTANAPVVHGHGAETMQARAALSAMFADGANAEITQTARDPDAPLGIEPRGAGGSSPSSGGLATLPRSDLPQNVAMQIAAAIQKGGPGMKPGIELMLSPQELGPVRLTFTQSETGLIVNVQAERAETLELLRRNIDTLAQEFLDIGYGSAEFTFDRREAHAQDAAPPVKMDEPDAAPKLVQDAPDPITTRVLVADRLDIRL